MFKLNCVGNIIWNSDLEEFGDNKNCAIAFVICTERERMTKYKSYLNDEEEKDKKEDTIMCIAYGTVARYIDKCIRNKKRHLIEVSGLLEENGDKMQANSNKITYYERDLDKSVKDPDAFEKVNSGFEDNVYIELKKYRFLVKEASSLENAKKKNTSSNKKTAQRKNKDKDIDKDKGKDEEKDEEKGDNPKFVKQDTEDDWDNL